MNARSAPNPYGWRVGSLLGTPVYIGRTWPVIVLLIVVMFGPILSRSDRPGWYGYVVAAGYAVLLFVSVLVHEAAHAFAARARGRTVDRIAIDVWGGHTVYDSRGSSATTEAIVAIAGPLANLALGGVGYLLRPVVTTETGSLLLDMITYANLLVAVFNLLPGLPLDGGHVVSSLVWGVTGSRTKGMIAAGWMGRVVAVCALGYFVVAPLLRGQQPNLLSLLWIGMICLFLWRGASAAIAGGRVIDATAVSVFEVVEPVTPVRVDDSVSLARATGTGGALVVVTNDFRPVGLIDGAALEAVPESSASSTPVSAVMLGQPDNWAFALPADALLTDLVRIMGERGLSNALPVDPSTGQVIGLVRAETVNTFIGRRLGDHA